MCSDRICNIIEIKYENRLTFLWRPSCIMVNLQKFYLPIITKNYFQIVIFQKNLRMTVLCISIHLTSNNDNLEFEFKTNI